MNDFKRRRTFWTVRAWIGDERSHEHSTHRFEWAARLSVWCFNRAHASHLSLAGHAWYIYDERISSVRR